jgi:molybdenum-dependent DNA-binding transcriptional regulator ModE
MGRKSSITPEQGEALLEAYKRLNSVRAAALELGVSEDAAGRYIAKFAESTAPVVAQQQHIAESVGASLWDTKTVLEQNYKRLEQLIAHLEKGIEIHGVAALETLSPKQITAYVGAIRAMNSQAETSLKLLEALTNIQAIQAFQQSVLEALGEADPALRQRAIAILKERRALGLALFQPTRS